MNRYHETRDPIGWNREEASHRYWNNQTGKVEDDREIPLLRLVPEPEILPESPEAQRSIRAPYRKLAVVGSLQLFEAPWVRGIEIRRGQDSVAVGFNEIAALTRQLVESWKWEDRNAGS